MEASVSGGPLNEYNEFHNCAALLRIIKACVRERDLCRGSQIHVAIVQRGLLQRDIHVGTALLSMYARCGVHAKAQAVFEELPVWDVVCWNALIGGYAQHGLADKALKCFAWMQEEGFPPDTVTFISLLKACGSIGASKMGKEIHSEVSRRGLLAKSVAIGTALVDMYVKCGALAMAQEVFDELSERNVISWTALIAGYAQHSTDDKALKCYVQMRDEGFCANSVTFVLLLKVCGSLWEVKKGVEIHAEISKQGFLERDVILGNAVVDMYAKCCALAKAEEVFDELSVRDTVTWNALIAGYAQHGFGHEALKCFEKMRIEGSFPDTITFTSLVNACSSIGAAEKGEELHAEVNRQGLLGKDIELDTALVDMYAKWGALAKAEDVFDKLPVCSALTWTAMIAGYAQQGLGHEALNCFQQMRGKGLLPNAVTFTCLLKACSSMGAVQEGEAIHDEVRRRGLLEKDIALGTALVDMYAKCGVLSKAQQVFDKLKAPDVVSWSALIAGYAQHGQVVEALECFEQMQDQGFLPLTATWTCVLKVCGSIGAADKGEQIYTELSLHDLFENSVELGNALVEMYAKCGILVKAQAVFDKISTHDITSWNALIIGYTQHGKIERVFHLFSTMLREDIGPDVATFVALLSTCSHAALVEEGQIHTSSISAHCSFSILEHSSCLVDLFSRAGNFNKALNVIKRMPSCNRDVLLIGLLGSCQKWVNVQLGKWICDHIVHLVERNAAALVCMSNILADAWMQEDVDKVCG